MCINGPSAQTHLGNRTLHLNTSCPGVSRGTQTPFFPPCPLSHASRWISRLNLQLSVRRWLLKFLHEQIISEHRANSASLFRTAAPVQPKKKLIRQQTDRDITSNHCGAVFNSFIWLSGRVPRRDLSHFGSDSSRTDTYQNSLNPCRLMLEGSASQSPDHMNFQILLYDRTVPAMASWAMFLLKSPSSPSHYSRIEQRFLQFGCASVGTISEY